MPGHCFRQECLHGLLDLAVYGVLAHDRVVFFQLHAFRRILAVFLGHIARRTGQTAVLVLRALQNDLKPVAFTFLCHFTRNSKFGYLEGKNGTRILPAHILWLLNVILPRSEKRSRLFSPVF